MTAIRLCALADLADGGAAEFTIAATDGPIALFAVRKGGDVYAYVNSCPHIGAPLNFRPSGFLSIDKTHILCSTHGAQFTIRDGLCVLGPCQGKKLQSLPVTVQDDEVFVRRRPM